MKALYLLRHAKSSWSDPSLDDFDRPLNKRGRQACALVGAYMARHAIAPDLVLCSPARRARETVERVGEALGHDLPVVFEKRLYMAAIDGLLGRLHGVPDDVGAVMMIGHNPGMEDFAFELIGGGDVDAGERMMEKYPTAALAILAVETARWRDVGPGDASLEAFVRPRDLAID